MDKMASKKTAQCLAREALQKQKNIIPYRDGYKIEGYFGYVADLDEAKRVVKLLESQGK